jgi:class 3 adenylate cyclase/DNA-binding SARP family transcriptional activator/TolB-like protein
MARRLAAILAADVAGYSRLMHEDEEATHATFNSTMAGLVQPSVRRHAGRIVKSTGDGFIAEFASPVEAVRCALEFQEAVVHKASTVPEKRRLLFRVGIDVGDIIVEKNDIFGDHVNIAARLEQLAEPGGILISSSVHDYVRDRISCRFEDTGPRQVKNIARPIQAFAILPAGADSARAATAVRAATRLPQAGTDRGPAAKLQLFGAVSLRIGEQEIALRSLKSRALLGYIALTPNLRESRERLVGLLWSESSESQARAVLRQVVRELRDRIAQVRSEGFNFGTYEIGFEAGTVDVDVVDVLAAAEAGRVHPLLLEQEHLTEQLLAGLDEIDPAFRVWLIAKRNMLRDSLQRGLEKGLEVAPQGSAQEADLAKALLNIDPTNEEACRRLMRARANAGDVAGALRIYKTLWDLLSEDYDMEPSAETQVLVAEIKGAPSMLPSRMAPAYPTTLSDTSVTIAISVPPPTMHQINSDELHLVAGFRQHLINSLVRFREWQVTDAPFEEAALGTSGTAGRYELQTNVHQHGAALHLLLMLRHRETNVFIWSDGFELNLEHWFENQRRVVQRIAIALNVNLSAEQLRRVADRPDVSLGVYDRWLRCQTLIRTFNLQHWENAEKQFAEIIQAAPRFVPAYCGLVDMHNTTHIVYPGKLRSREREQQALTLARQAVELDPSNMNAHRSLAWAHAMAGQHALATSHIETAYDLNPSDPWTHFSAALLLAFCGERERSNQLVRLATETALVPNKVHWAYLVDIHFLAGNYEQALIASDYAQDGHRTVRAWRAASFAQLGNMAAAAEEAQKFLQSIRAGWFGAEQASDRAVARWLLHLYPISDAEPWERLRAGLEKAGLPRADIEFMEW